MWNALNRKFNVFPEPDFFDSYTKALEYATAAAANHQKRVTIMAVVADVFPETTTIVNDAVTTEYIDGAPPFTTSYP